MKYYYLNGIIEARETEIDASLYSDFTVLTKAQYDFAVLNPSANLIEIKAKKLNDYVPTLAELKAQKLSELDLYIYDILKTGYTDSNGWILFTSEKDVNNYATLKNAIVDMNDKAEVEIGTATGWIKSTKSVVYPCLVRYSAYMLPITTNYLKLKSYIENANESQLPLITW